MVVTSKSGMDTKYLLTVVLIAVQLISQALGYSSGPPENACRDMMPGHGFGAQTSPPPYRVETNATNITPGSYIGVTLIAEDGHPFKGFFIQARNAFRSSKKGNFVQAGRTKVLCGGSSISHTEPSARLRAPSSYYIPENVAPGELRLVATVVARKETYWINVTSLPIFIVSGDAEISSRGLDDKGVYDRDQFSPRDYATVVARKETYWINVTSLPIFIDSGDAETSSGGLDNKDGDDNSASHSQRKINNTTTISPETEPAPSGTITLHSDCGKTRGCFHDCVNGVSCSFVVYWKPMNDSVLFRIVYKLPSRTDKWIALALSHDGAMGHDSVMECVMDDVEVLVKTSYNNGKYNDYPDDKQAALSRYSGFIKNGILGCQFVRKISYPREPKVFDLHSSYYLFIATGEAVAGTAMILAWVLFANIGVFVSRHGRNMFSSSTPCGTDVWFHIHRFCMTMTLFLTLVGFLLILIESHGRSHIPQVPGKSYVILHPPLGLIVIILTIVNPLMALYRPATSSPSRPLFKWTHWGFGVFSWFVSFIVIAIGLNLQKAQAEVESVYIIIAFMGYSFVMEILIRVIPFTCGAVGYCCKKITCGRRDSYDFNIELRPSEIASISSVHVTSSKDSMNSDLDSIMRTENTATSIMILFHIAACIAFTAGVLYFSLRHSLSIIIDGH